MAEQTIRVVVFKSGERWVAQCLEYDLCTSSADLERLPRQLISQLRTQVALDRRSGRQPFAGLSRAPQRFWDLYEQADRSEVLALKPSLLDRLLALFQRRLPSELPAQIALAVA